MRTLIEARNPISNTTNGPVSSVRMPLFAFSPGGAAAGAVPSPAPARAGARILLVEDDDDVREVSVRFLEFAGYRVVGACDGEEAWDTLQRHDFDLLITDNRMPRLTGVGLLKRTREAGMTLPAILASGSLPWDELDAPPELQPVSTLTKPYSGHELLAKVQAHLRARATPFRLAPGVALHE